MSFVNHFLFAVHHFLQTECLADLNGTDDQDRYNLRSINIFQQHGNMLYKCMYKLKGLIQSYYR